LPKKRESKTAEKSPGELPALVPQAHGGALLVGGLPGNAGGTGRPPEEFRNFLSRMRKDPKVQASLEKALNDPETRGFASALKVLTEYDTEKPAERKHVEGKVEVVVRIQAEGRRVTAS
jgi:hypothetical protein